VLPCITAAAKPIASQHAVCIRANWCLYRSGMDFEVIAGQNGKNKKHPNYDQFNDLN
jgi:hypothetical protein